MQQCSMTNKYCIKQLQSLKTLLRRSSRTSKFQHNINDAKNETIKVDVDIIDKIKKQGWPPPIHTHTLHSQYIQFDFKITFI